MDEIDAFFDKAKKMCLSEAERSACLNRITQKMAENPVRDTKESCPTEHMTDFDPALAQKAQAIRLTIGESDRAGKALFAFMKDHPVDMAAALRQHEKRSGFFELFSLRFSPVVASVLMLVLGTGSLSYAAEYALPGDALYPVKIHVNETVHAALAVNAEAKAEWEAIRAERRVKEATKLAEKGRLTEEKSASLAVAFNTHIAAAHSKIEVMAKAGNRDRAKKVGEKTEAALRKQIIALKNNNAVVAMRQYVEQAADATIALDSKISEEIVMDASSTPAAMMMADASSSVESSSVSSRTIVAVDLMFGKKAEKQDRAMKQDADTVSHLKIDGGNAKISIAQDHSINALQMTSFMNKNATSSSSKASGTGSSSIKKSSASSLTIQNESSAGVDIHVSSSAGLPIKVDIQTDGSIDVKIVSPEKPVVLP